MNNPLMDLPEVQRGTPILHSRSKAMTLFR
jgi:hypothetical protein